MPGFRRIIAHAFFYFSWYCFATVVAVLLCFSVSGGSLVGSRIKKSSSGDETNHYTASSTAVPATAYAPVSLQEACQTEMRLYCHDYPTSPLRCVVEQYSRTTHANDEKPNQLTSALYSDACGSWLAAREICLGFVNTRGRELCGDTVRHSRECLRRIPPAVLPHACVTSGYYESVRLIGKLRQHRTVDDRLRVLYEASPKGNTARQYEADEQTAKK
ncbi:hypothetical protein JKF63_00062 [Porcisia hertigi]|uniref:Uncharacterized protein n=1 Tax=Porcisia hertigi TaxID=2761500 RepID=A0A836HCF7_9TRYP|nr:hypothetical protein JKF63_00062 [Porcisia hertigi]